MKGLAIGNQPLIKKVHNSFSRFAGATFKLTYRPEPFSISQVESGKADAFHFISYVPIKGKLYELDGLKAGPICLGDCTDDDWLKKVAPVIKQRMDQYVFCN